MNDRWKALFGFLLLLIIGALAAVVALGKVYADSSHGLQIILGCFTTLSGAFATWAFGGSGGSKKGD